MRALAALLVAAGCVCGSAGAAQPKSPPCPPYFAGKQETMPLGTATATLSIACNDGAAATALVGGKKLPAFVGGVCWTELDGSFHVQIGATGAQKERPTGILLNVEKKRTVLGDTATIEMGATYWSYRVKVAQRGPRVTGSFTGAEPGGDTAKASWTCKRIRRLPV